MPSLADVQIPEPVDAAEPIPNYNPEDGTRAESIPNYDPSNPPEQTLLANEVEHDPYHSDYMQPTDATPPSHQGAKFVKYNQDGSALFSNGVTFLQDGSIKWEDKDTGIVFAQKNPYVKAVKLGPKKLSPDEESEKLAREAGARKGVIPGAYATPEEYKKARTQALNPNALGGDAASGSTGEESLAGLSDADKATVKLMAEYKWPIPPGGIRNPKQLALLQRAAQYDQTFAPAEYTIRQKSKMDYSSGKSFQNIRSLNTLAGHLDNLSKSAEALNNSSTKPINYLLNKAESSVMGDPRLKVFETDVNAVTNELGQLLRGGAVTDQDVKRWQGAIGSSDSPAQLKATIHEFADLAKSRLDALQQGYEGVMRKPADIQIMSPKAKASFKKLGVLSDEEISATPGGAKGYGAQPQLSPSATPLNSPEAAAIKEAYRAGKMTKEQARAALLALGQ